MPQALDAYAASLQSLLAASAATGMDGSSLSIDSAISEAVKRISGLRGTESKVIAIGNGGSSAIANHFVLDLWKNAGIRAESFSDSSLLTCAANDYGYPEVFSKPLAMFANKGDILFAISSSGRSENILRAVKEAGAIGLWCVTLSGFKPDNPLRRLGHVNLFVDSGSYGMVELAHSVICHHISDMLMEKR